ncbi:uncharacterized protein LOC124310551 [Neodiprion virginianus]|uniref:uncharacterized protein LOC124176438 n=1 Tax=Neodiprion fabricii TaxID=2872261 RepID=UPI001ED90979|nr:uncharacterized protein LOC124176438 [Neodiprion fabricii]XP_046630559.1 uncharacterized protein LOC124310551 [Neodiprion virginianus]
MHVQVLYLLMSVYVLSHCEVDALLCFECNSHNDSRCAEALPPDVLKKDCSDHVEGSKYTMCRKITQVIEFSVNGLPADSRVIRGCGWDESNYMGRCYQRSGFGGRQEVCSCVGDYCNGATESRISIFLIATVIVGFLAFWRN